MGARDELARLLLSRHEWKKDAALARIAIRQLDRRIAELDRQLDLLDVDDTAPGSGRCGAPLRGGQGRVCGLPARHVDSPSEHCRKHRSTESLRRRRAAA